MNGSSNVRAIAACLLLPLLYSLERLAYYGHRSVLFRYLLEERGMAREDVSGWLGAFTNLSLGFGVLGGVIAIGIGPRYTLAFGAAIAGTGFALLLPFVPIQFALIPIAVGVGILKPCVWAAAAEALPDPRESARNALAFALYFAINAAAYLATLIAPELGQQAGSAKGIFIACAGTMSLVTVLALALAVTHTVAGRGQPRQSTAFRGEPLLGVVLLFVLSIPYYLSLEMGTMLPIAAGDSAAAWRLLAFNPVFVGATCVPLFLAMVALALMKKRAATLVIAGLGMVAVALGVVPLIVLPAQGAALLASVVVMSAGEAAIGPLMASRVTGGVHPRLVTLVFAIFVAGTVPANALSRAVEGAPAESLKVLAGAVAFMTLAGGVILAALHFARPFVWPDPPVNAGSEVLPPEPAPTAFSAS